MSINKKKDKDITLDTPKEDLYLVQLKVLTPQAHSAMIGATDEAHAREIITSLFSEHKGLEIVHVTCMKTHKNVYEQLVAVNKTDEPTKKELN